MPQRRGWNLQAWTAKVMSCLWLRLRLHAWKASKSRQVLGGCQAVMGSHCLLGGPGGRALDMAWHGHAGLAAPNLAVKTALCTVLRCRSRMPLQRLPLMAQPLRLPGALIGPMHHGSASCLVGSRDRQGPSNTTR